MKIFICGLLAIALTGCKDKPKPKPGTKRLVSRIDCKIDRVIDSRSMVVEYYKKMYVDDSSTVAASITIPGSKHITMKNYRNGSRLGELGQVTVKTDDDFFLTFILTDDSSGINGSKGVVVNFPTQNGLAVIVSSYKECELTNY